MVGKAYFGNFSDNITLIKYGKASAKVLFRPSLVFCYTETVFSVYTSEQNGFVNFFLACNERQGAYIKRIQNS